MEQKSQKSNNMIIVPSVATIASKLVNKKRIPTARPLTPRKSQPNK